MYPPIKARSEFIEVGRVEGVPVRLYVEHAGNESGIPVIYLHGGPGDSINPHLRRLFNPNRYHIILFDQRGCGKSTPRNLLQNNNTQHLLKDMEVIRKAAGVEKMVVAGGSWGSSLALLYAEAFPERTLGLILRGVFDLSLDDDVMDVMYAEQNTELCNILKTKSKSRLYYTRIDRLLKSKTRKRDRQRVIDILSDDAPLAVFNPIPGKLSEEDKYTMTLVGNHYERNNFFAKPKQIYRDLHKIQNIPVYIVQGRYDMVTPMVMAWRVYQKLDHCRLVMTRGGHTHWEKDTTLELCRAADDMFKTLQSEKTLKKSIIDKSRFKT